MTSIYHDTINKILEELDKGTSIYTRIVKPFKYNASLYRSGDFYILEKDNSCGNALFSRGQLINMLENGTLDLMFTRRKTNNDSEYKILQFPTKEK